ncbi:hypothetical protein BDZ97DRAFT_1696676 [Flammula alnicola]|nr:hypothetical protein BDZ97DRAFT_1696676 [Flammula alnicola]
MSEAQRRSTRLAMTSPAGQQFVCEEDEEDEEAPVEQKTRGKKRKTEDRQSKGDGQSHAKKIRGRRGKLEDLVEMPLDVLFEIFARLKPIDLLNLARTSKDLRAMLMSRSSSSIWKEARTHVIPALPECPEDLSEPEYANFLFGKNCHHCARKVSTTHIGWDARTRICSRCMDDHCVPLKNFRPSGYPEILKTFIPGISVIKKSGRYNRFVFFKFDDLWRKQYQSMDTTTAKNKWLEEKVKERKAIKEHAVACEAWFKKVLEDLDLEKTRLIEDRRAIVVKRVKELGWGDELAKMTQYYDPRPQDSDTVTKVCQKDLTEQILLNLEPYLNQHMERVKRDRVYGERKDLLRKRLPILGVVRNNCVSTLPVNGVYPTANELLCNPAIRNIIDNTPLSANFTEDDLAQTVAQLFPDITRQLQQDIELQLLELLPKEYGPDPIVDPKTAFELATTVFACASCNRFLRHPRVLVHSCTMAYKCPPEIEDHKVLNELYTFHDRDRYRNHRGCISFDEKSAKLIGEVVEMCGFDGLTTTAKQMDDANPIFECVGCNDPHQGRVMMTWAGVLNHSHLVRDYAISNETLAKSMELELVSEKEANIVRERMKEEQERRRARCARELICAHCGHDKDDSVKLAQHVKNVHSIPNPTSKDMVPAIDRDHVPPIFYMWPPRST